MDKREDDSGSQGELDETLTIHQMMKDVPKRRREGWRFRYGIDGHKFTPEDETETILANYTNKFRTDEEALAWVKQCAAEGSIYHQRAIEYVVAAQMSPKSMIFTRSNQ